MTIRFAFVLILFAAPRAAAAPTVDFDGDGLADIAVPATDLPGETCQTTHDGRSCYRPDGPSHEVIALFLGKDRGKLSRTVRIATHKTAADPTLATQPRLVVMALDGAVLER